MDLTKPQRVMLWKFSAYGFLKNLRFFEPFLLVFFLEKGLSFTQFGALIAVREVAVWLLEVPTGIVADVSGRRRAMVLCFASYLVSFGLFAAFDSFWIFAAAMVLFGAGEAFRSGTHKSMIMQHLDLEGLRDLRVHYYGTTRSVSRLGSAVSVLAAGVVVFFTGSYSLVFVASMVPYVLGLLLMLTYPAELDGKVTARLSLREVWQHTADSFVSIWRTPELLKTLLNVSTANAFFRVSKDYLQPILKTAAITTAVSLPVLAFAGSDEQRTAVLIAVVYFAIHLNEFWSSRNAGRLADRIGHLGRALNVLYWAFALMFLGAGGALLFYYRESGGEAARVSALAAAVLMLFFFYTLNNLRMPVVTGFLSDRTEAQQRATVLSVLSQLRAVLAAVAAPVFGLIADRFGIPFVFLVGGVVLLAAGALLRLEEGTPDATGAKGAHGEAKDATGGGD